MSLEKELVKIHKRIEDEKRLGDKRVEQLYNMIVKVFPVNSIFFSTVSTNPNTLLGYGTWARIAEGKFLVGQDGGDADFDVGEETGGAKTIDLAHTHSLSAHTHAVGTLAIANESAHTHGVGTYAVGAHQHVAPIGNWNNRISMTAAFGSAVETQEISWTGRDALEIQETTFYKSKSATPGFSGASAAGSAHSHSLSGATAVPSSDVTDSQLSATQSILPPYFVMYIWKRTA